MNFDVRQRDDFLEKRYCLRLWHSHSAHSRIGDEVNRNGRPLRDPIELGSMEAIKELVKLGLGVSIVAQWIARAEINERSLVWLHLPGGQLKRTWCIAAAAGRKLSVAEQTFVGLCQNVAMNFGQ